MIVDPGILLGDRARPRVPETDSDRAARVRQIAALVKSGSYAVQTHRLALALLDWDPRRASPKGAADTADRRRTYMRDYMRRRRAARQLVSGGDSPAPAYAA